MGEREAIVKLGGPVWVGVDRASSPDLHCEVKRALNGTWVVVAFHETPYWPSPKRTGQ